jgi:beta-phosphoglucomutase-like phosphatase (HAD superfamily)
MSFELEPGTFDALIFDCDGTLVETLPAHVAALQTALAGTGLKPTAAWARTKYGQSPATVLLAVERELGPIGLPHEEVLRDWSANYGKNLQRLEEIEPVSDVARAWRGRVPMAVASNGHRASVVATLEAVGLSGLFDTVVAIDDVRKGKPAPDLFLEAARRMGVPPERCVVFEDSEEGMEAARSAGMRVVYAPGI